MRNRIDPDKDMPGFFVFETCNHFWRTVPDLQLDERNPEKGPESSQEDHCVTKNTKVITDNGAKKITQIKTNDMVLTTEGFLPCVQLDMTGYKEVYTVELSDGYKFKCTGSHPILIPSGMYVRLDNLHKGDKVCALRLLQKENKYGTIKDIGCVENISNVVEKDFIGLFGNTLMEKYQKITMFITKTIIEPTIKLKTLNLFTSQSTCRFMPRKCYLHQKEGQQNLEQLLPHKMPLKHGMEAQKEKHGIASTLKKVRQMLNLMTLNVKSVAFNLNLKEKIQNFVQINAGQNHLELTILNITKEEKKENVFNLHVKGPNNFVLENGLIVHNCYDAISYALVSRPMVWTRRARVNVDYDEARDKAFEADRGGKSQSRY
jgi:hypothetical protein